MLVYIEDAGKKASKDVWKSWQLASNWEEFDKTKWGSRLWKNDLSKYIAGDGLFILELYVILVGTIDTFK